MTRLLAVFIFIGSFACIVTAQDIHFTRFYDSPLTLNPAKAGDYLGTFRLGGIFRDQNYNYSHVFVTPSAYLDAPIIKGFAKTHWVGAGISFLQDVAGQEGLKNNDFAFNLAYHIGLDKNMESSVSIGASYGLAARSVSDKTKLLFGEFYTQGTSEDQNNVADNKVNFKDVNAGIQYTGVLNESGQLRLGLSVNHINRPRYGVLKGATYRLPMRINIYGTVDMPITDKIDILPTAYYSSISNHHDIVLQLMGGLRLNPLKGTRITAGLGYRFGDALEILAGMDIGTFKVGLAYDLTLNPIRPTGGFELSLSKIFMIYKKPKDNPVILCPRL